MTAMTQQEYAESIATILRSIAPANRLRQEDVGPINQLALQWSARDQGMIDAVAGVTELLKPEPAAIGPIKSIADLQTRIGVPATGAYGDETRDALFAALSNPDAPALSDEEFAAAADRLGVSPKLIRAIRKVEAPRGPFDEQGRPSILYERHIFAQVTGGRFTAKHAVLSWAKWVPGTYGPFSAQYGKLSDACALDPEAAFQACSWGAFQVLGRNAIALGYGSAFEMAIALAESEAAHLESFIRFVKVNNLVAALRKCRAGDPTSCIPFVRGYNGEGYARNRYHIKLAEAAR